MIAGGAPAAGMAGQRGIHAQGTAEDFAWAFVLVLSEPEASRACTWDSCRKSSGPNSWRTRTSRSSARRRRPTGAEAARTATTARCWTGKNWMPCMCASRPSPTAIPKWPCWNATSTCSSRNPRRWTSIPRVTSRQESKNVASSRAWGTTGGTWTLRKRHGTCCPACGRPWRSDTGSGTRPDPPGGA